MINDTISLALTKPDGTLLTRVEAEKELWDKCKTSHVMRRLAWGQFGLDNRFAWVLKPTSITHWLLDEMIRKRMIAGDSIGVQPELESDDSYFNSYVQRLMVFVEDGRALKPKEGEGIDMGDFPQNQPPPPQNMPGYAPPPPPMGFGQQPPPPQQQFQQPPQQMPPPAQYGAPPPQPQFGQPGQGMPPAMPQFGGPPPQQPQQQFQQPPQFAPPGAAPGQQQFAPPQGMPPAMPQMAAPPQQAAPPAPAAQTPSNRRRGAKTESAAAGPPPGAPMPQQQAMPGFGAPPAMPQFGQPPMSAGPAMGSPAGMAPMGQASGGTGTEALQAEVRELKALVGQLGAQVAEMARIVKGIDAASSLVLRAFYNKPLQSVAQANLESALAEVGIPYPS